MEESSSAFLARVLESLIERCGEGDTAAMGAARVEFDERRGRVFEDEEEWEARTAIFLEYFAVERADPETGESPAVAAARAATDDREREALLALSRSYRCLGEVIEIAEGRVVFADAIGGAHIEITERRGLPGVSVGDVAEIRVVAFEGAVHFGSQILWHPPGTRDPLLAHVEALLDAGHDRESICDFAASLKIRSLRYGHLEPAAVYEKFKAEG